MSTASLIINALFFTVNSCAVLFIVIVVTRAIKRMENKLDYHIALMQYIRLRQSAMFLSTLKEIKERLVNRELYEEAKVIQELIDKELEYLNDKHIKTE